MPNDNFDFGGHIEDDTDVSPRRYNDEQEAALSPYGLLINRVGYARGKDIYDAMVRIANRAVDEHGGVPGVVFDCDGGRFVSITSPSLGG
jgi:hypothetical protein